MEAISIHHAIIVTDASIQAQTNIGAASWVLVDKYTNDGLSFGDHGVPQGNKNMDSYRERDMVYLLHYMLFC